ncbi:alpha/beta hydrolase [Pleomorphomonas carboxyditropha]|uniref:alpha/beta hydrolase n=1 Tax=Pleomorphomonas carboxyditropha TaxID=2023338 RepID=UPI0013FD4270|nr:alpha/beta hydrolase [Pleomorphomonas carboxyditropha]
MRPANGEQPVLEKLIHVISDDGYALAGCLFESENRAADLAIVWVHGVSLGFAEPEYAAIGRAAARLGASFLSVETRGHNFGAWLRGPDGRTKLAGSAWEYLVEAPSDIGPWLRRARALGRRRVVMVGHGWGAAKIVYALAQSGTDGVDGVVCASSASLVRDQLDPTLVEEAARLTAAGNGWHLLPWGTRPGMAPNTISAETYAMRARVHRELYGSGGIPPALSRIDVPILAWFGDAEGRSEDSIQGFFGSMRRNAITAPSFQTAILTGGNYLYTGIETAVSGRIVAWAGGLGERAAGHRKSAR